MSTIANVEREAFLKWVDEHRAYLKGLPWFESVEQLIESGDLDAAHQLTAKNALRIYGEPPSFITDSKSQPPNTRDSFRQTSDQPSDWRSHGFNNVLAFVLILAAAIFAYMSLDLFTSENEVV